MGNVFVLDIVYYCSEPKLAVVQMRTPIAKVFTCIEHFHMYIILSCVYKHVLYVFVLCLGKN